MAAVIRTRTRACALAAGLVFLVGCGSSAGDDPGPPIETTTPAPEGDERGEVVSSEPVTDIDPAVAATGATVTRVTYRTTSGIDGSGVDVVATVFAPAGPAPEGGFPVVTVGHGTTGVEDECAPSLSPTLMGTTSMVTPLLERGWVAVVSDYQGLGTPGPHPYLDADSAGYDLVDAVRAAREVVPETSTRWAAIGGSQGGQASWAAAELAAEYGDGLDLVGAANLSPAADLSPILRDAVGVDDGGTLPLTWPQTLLMPFVLDGVAAVDQEFDESRYVRGVVAENPDVTRSCVTDRIDEKLRLASQIRPTDIGPQTTRDAEELYEHLADAALPRRGAGAPMFVAVGGADNVIDAAWTRDAVLRACALGDTIEYVYSPEQGHSDPNATASAVEWVGARFAGEPPPNSCGADLLP
ncbi:lipase family protein [Rhodococcus rhodnii]|uniref:Lipase n=1 Tax=Rhodococcus rhodnii LMG 5362 TaxID=1273125 RepID=R7WR22_9NOCA|nr:lipase [Rhodococcus rhodnii LMG 5362]